jgi:hypothetical protein
MAPRLGGLFDAGYSRKNCQNAEPRHCQMAHGVAHRNIDDGFATSSRKLYLIFVCYLFGSSSTKCELSFRSLRPPRGLDAPMRFRKNYAEFLEGLGVLERLDRLTLL